MTTLAVHRSHVPFWAVVGAGIVAWLSAWILLAPAVDWLTTDVLGLDTSEGFGAAVRVLPLRPAQGHAPAGRGRHRS